MQLLFFCALGMGNSLMVQVCSPQVIRHYNKTELQRFKEELKKLAKRTMNMSVRLEKLPSVNRGWANCYANADGNV
ncbi:MAG: hypothetical protein IPN76_09770 [Saprospiraceae bacterium]|nr:hypothetical protein [Saprospiraceae bacterium]